MDYPKRLIEVDLPIKRISAHARREKSIRHGHISTLHIWWARRPLAACRAVICAALWPDPPDEKCPQAFRDEARRLMTDWAANHLDLTSPESMSRFNRVKNDPSVLADNVELRKALLDFIADFANWDNSPLPAYLETSRALTQAAHETLGGAPGTLPMVADPFAGGGAIPLEALRVGADAFASDLNPVAVLLNKVVLEYLPRYGQQLVQAVESYGEMIGGLASNALSQFFPDDSDGATPVAYLWARTVLSEAPGQAGPPIEVPMLRSMWICKKPGKKTALRWKRNANGEIETEKVHKTFANHQQIDVLQPQLEIFTPKKDSDLEPAPVARGSVTCPISGFTTPVSSVRAQLGPRHGGSLDGRLYCVAISTREQTGRSYRLPTAHDLKSLNEAFHAYAKNAADLPSEVLPLMSGVFNAPIYGHNTWGSLFNYRQALVLLTLSGLVRDIDLSPINDTELAKAVRVCLTFAVGRCANQFTSLSKWHTGRELVDGVFARQAIPMLWDYGELNFLEGNGYWDGAIKWITAALERSPRMHAGQVEQADASQHVLPSDSVDALFTDPPYYNAVPYADLSDFFYVWQKRILHREFSHLFGSALVPKDGEICEMAGWDPARYSHKTGQWFERQMGLAMAEARRVLSPDGIGVVVFAHKSTGGWEAQLQAMIDAGWTVTASWPVDTELGSRLRARNSAALASSVHLVCRPREGSDGTLLHNTVGDWRQVLVELPKRIHEWMPRLAEEGVVGADAIFACLGPALEIYSRYSRVEKVSGDVVKLREYLEQVWAAVSTEALSMIFRDADAAGLESDARFTAIMLWTVNAGDSVSSDLSEGESEEAEDEDDSPKGKAAKGGYTLEYDAARKIAQGLGVDLEQIDSVVEVKGDKARLLPVSERAATLFGKSEKAEAAAKKRGKKATQKKLFDKDADEGSGTTETVTLGDGAAATPGVTALDRVHQAMLLFAGGRADALKRFIVEDGVGGDARFWKLAQSLSALYPAGSDEKRWVDGVLARKKSFGF